MYVHLPLFPPLITAELMGSFNLSSLKVWGGHFRLLQVKLCDWREDRNPEISPLCETVMLCIGRRRTSQ